MRWILEHFVLETPDGYAVDFGTRFAVSINGNRKTSEFELIEGEIEVHHAASSKSMRLDKVGAAASVSVDSVHLIEDRMSNELSNATADHEGQVIRVSTQGRCGVALHNEKRQRQ